MSARHRTTSRIGSARALLCLTVAGIASAAACSGSSGGTGAAVTGPVGQSCTSAAQCYAGLDSAAVRGQVTCLTQLQNGYCTHTCTSDADCCGVPGECPAAFKETCASFESSGQMYCFLSCDTAAIASAPDAGTTDPTTFCQDWANPTFTCRSTGGGSANKKFCGP